MRPPGYEPGELPTAPPRDVSRLFLKSGAKVRVFFGMTKNYGIFFTSCAHLVAKNSGVDENLMLLFVDLSIKMPNSSDRDRAPLSLV